MTITWMLMLAQAVAAPVASTPAPPRDGGDIVVTGQRIEQTAKALAACIARQCPPDQDVAATLAHAENQFVAGQYKDARTTLLASLGRNKKFDKQYPVPVSSLWRANSRIAAHLGESESYRISSIEAMDALKAGLNRDDPRILAQQVEVGDTFAHLGRSEGAFDIYRSVASKAHALGDRVLEGHALFRIAVLNSALAEVQPGAYQSELKQSVAVIMKTTDPELAPFRDAAQLLLARTAGKNGDPAAIDRLIASFHGRGGTTPVLVYSPPLNRDAPIRAFVSGSTTGKLAVNSADNQWVDVSFWIAPDGTVSDASILRESPELEHAWVEPIVKTIGMRRYMPLALPAGTPGLLRVERYTKTAHWLDQVTGTRIRTREAYPRIEMMDLTADAPVKVTAG